MTLAVCRLLNSMGGKSEEEEMRAWLAPDGLYRREGEHRTPPRDDWGYTYALEVGEHLGFISREDDSYTLIEGCPTSAESFGAEVRKRVFSATSSALGRGEDDPATELGLALALWMTMPVWPPGSTWDDVQRHQLRFAPDGAGAVPDPRITNDVRWSVFGRWAVFLGFAWQFGDAGIVPDPTSAICELFDGVLQPGETLRLIDFVDALSKELPVLDRGTLWNALPRDDPNAAAVGVGEPLSFALLRLEQRGELAFETIGDEETVRLAVSNIKRRHSRVRRLSGAVAA
jgi:hypothetical protein